MRFVSPVIADGTIYIKPDGSVDPPTAPIRRDGNVYTFTDNIYDSIVVERDNIVVDGAGYTLQGTGSGTGIFLSDRSNVKIQNMQITHFENGIYLERSSGNNISGDTITNNDRGINLYWSSENTFYHNNFVDNTLQVNLRFMRTNVWDDGYPSGGNYWSDYLGVDQNRGENQNIPGTDGIGDTPYIIDDDYDFIRNNIDYYPLMNKLSPSPDTVPPIVSIISPENEVYTVTDVPLTFAVSEATSWIGYSLDNQANVTIAGNTILIGLSDGPHFITVYANDTAGNMGRSETVYFTIDAALPRITILSPENKIYAENDIPLSFTVDEPVSWMAYSLDGQANATITGNTTLTSLVDGMHYIVVYANDTAGKTGASNTVYFTVDTEAPIIIILSPKNETYASTSVSLNFTQSEPTSWMGYSLDGQMNVTVGGNITLIGLSEGIHSITVYAADISGNVGSSDVVYFTMDTVSVSIDLLSPQNKTYTTDSVSLSFTVDEETMWMGYSLDGQANKTITGDTKLTGLSDGTHSLVVYASDVLGNTGSSGTVYFTIDTVLPIIELLSPENKTYSVADVPLTFTLSEAPSWVGYSLDGQLNVTVEGNITLVGLSDAVHTLTVYANDTAGNMGASNVIHFTIDASPMDTKPPTISFVSPENKTYETTDIPLTFTADEPVSWMAYSLDGQTNVTITGDITLSPCVYVLSGLPEGSHSLIIYVRDTAGNARASEIIYFTVEPKQIEPSQLWIVAVIAIVAGVGFALSGYMAYALFKHPRTELRPRMKRTYCSYLFPK